MRAPVNPIHSFLDAKSAATVTSLTAPLVFFSEEPMLAANARDYIYLGPAELNRSGTYEYILWLEFFSTLDRGWAAGLDRNSRLVLMLDGKPMELAEAAADIDGLPYRSPVATDPPVSYRVTRDQLRLLGGARQVSIIAQSGTGMTREYRRWDKRAGLRNFAAYLDNDNRLMTTSPYE
jgi:hypothetical protein